jgi:hypothetical protein
MTQGRKTANEARAEQLDRWVRRHRHNIPGPDWDWFTRLILADWDEAIRVDVIVNARIARK